MKKPLVLLLVIALLTLTTATPALTLQDPQSENSGAPTAKQDPVSDKQLSGVEIANRVSRSVVLIKGTDSLGSGFIVSADGKIITNLHVIRNLSSGAVRLATGDIFDSFTVLGTDERKDIAIIKISGFDLPSVDLGNSNDVQPGETVMLFGNPKSPVLQGTITTGVISGIRDFEGVRLLQTDAAANPGNSGGPLLNSRGQVIGVLTSKVIASENLNFAVPINYVRGMLDNLQPPMTLAEMRRKLEGSTDVFAASAAPRVEVKVPDGTEIEIQLKNTASGEELKIGDIVDFSVVRPVVVNGVTIIDKDAPARGRITTAKKAGRWGKAGKLEWAMQDVQAVDGNRVPARFTKRSIGDSKGGTVAVAAVVTTVLLGPFGLLWGLKKGKPAIIPAGNRYSAFVSGDTAVKGQPTSNTP